MPFDRPVLCLTHYSFTLPRNPVLFFYVTFQIRAYSAPGTATVPEAAPQRFRQGLSADFMGVASSHHAQSIAPYVFNIHPWLTHSYLIRIQDRTKMSLSISSNSHFLTTTWEDTRRTMDGSTRPYVLLK